MKNYWNLKLSKAVFFVSLLCSVSVLAQRSEPLEKQPEEQYIYPIKPGQPGGLAGTMGELRATHFHSGIDIRTNNEVGYPVHASKSGYVSRVTMSGSGYGNVMYLTHPDGNTTLYAHLKEFKGDVGEYVLREQYRRKTFEIDLFFRENQFVFKQGDTIALSGNTGSTGGPHLHFDIRKGNTILNPLLYGFTEISDNLPPIVEKIALRTMDKNSRIFDRFGRFEYYPYRVGKNYVINNPIPASGKIGIEVLAHDKLNANYFRCGINHIEVYMDNQLVFKQALKEFDLEDTRSILTVMNFKALRASGKRFYKLYIDDGNQNDFYSTSPTEGFVHVDQSKNSTIEIRLIDDNNNMSTINFTLAPSTIIDEVRTLNPAKKEIEYDIDENILQIIAQPLDEATNTARVYVKGDVKEVEPDYFNTLRAEYLFDLRDEIPDSIIVGENRFVPNIQAVIPPAIPYTFYSDAMDISFPPLALFDTLYFQSSRTVKIDSGEVFSIGNWRTPLNKHIAVTLKQTGSYPDKSRLAVYRHLGKNRYAYHGGTWTNGQLKFYTREFGSFSILEDSTPPSIRTLYVNSRTLRFKVWDDLSGIDKMEAYINGEWVLMHYDAKSSTLWSEKSDKSTPFKGDLELIITDNAGNKQVLKQKIL